MLVGFATFHAENVSASLWLRTMVVVVVVVVRMAAGVASTPAYVLSRRRDHSRSRMSCRWRPRRGPLGLFDCLQVLLLGALARAEALLGVAPHGAPAVLIEVRVLAAGVVAAARLVEALALLAVDRRHVVGALGEEL